MEYTAEEIARHYSAATDSVNLLSAGKPSDMDEAEWAGMVQRNVDHLKIMVAKDFWTNEDLTPLNDAIAADEV